MDNPFLEEKNFALLIAPAYRWTYIIAGSGLSFGLGDEEFPIPRAFLILNDGIVSVSNGVGEDVCFNGKAGMFIPGAICYVNSDTTSNILVFY